MIVGAELGLPPLAQTTIYLAESVTLGARLNAHLL